MKWTPNQLQSSTAMTRWEILGITCVTLVSVVLITYFLRTGEFIKLKWPKKAQTSVREVAENAVESFNSAFELEKEVEEPPAPTSVPRPIASTSRNDQKQKAIGSQNAGIPLLRLDDPKHHSLGVPPNAIWTTNGTRKGPGVKIAFP